MSSLKKLLSFLIIALFCLSILPQKSTLVNAGAEENPGLTKIEKAVNFLLNSQFNASLSLCREAPEVAPNTYWLVSDNLWAYKALEMMNITDISSLIKAELIELAQLYNLPADAQGLPISYAHEAVTGDTVLVPFHASTNCTLYRNDYVLNTTMLNGTIMDDWQEYTDLLLFAALSYHWQGNNTAANWYFKNATDTWDGIGDTFHTIFSMIMEIDHYPLMQPIRTFEVGLWEGKTCNVNILSNSTVSNFKLNRTASTISFNVTGDEGTVGFCRIIIPNVVVQDLWNRNYTVLLNGEAWHFRNWTDLEGTYISINYTHSEHEITIIPEFPKATILTIFIVIVTSVIIAKKKLNKPKATKSRRNPVCNRFA